MANTTNTTNNPRSPMNPAPTAYKPGDEVTLRAEFAEGCTDTFIVLEWNDNRGLVCAKNWPYGPISPSELVLADMIQPVK